MGKSRSRLLTQQPPEIGPGDLFVSNVIARADLEPQVGLNIDMAIAAAITMMLPDIRQMVREEGPLTIKLIVACESYKAPRAPSKKHMG